MITNKYLIAGISVLVVVVIAVVIFFVAGSDNEPELPTVILTNEAKTSYSYDLAAAYGGPVHLPLPVKTEAALVEGWIDTGSCAPGQGRYFYKTNPQSNEKLDYLLIYNTSDILIGVYFYSKESLSPPTALLPEPWKIAEELNPLIDYPHSNVAVYFGDSANACSKESKPDGLPTSKLVNNTASGMVTAIELPMIASQATAGGWVDTFLCETGKGRFYYKLKSESDEKLEYLLIYNIRDVLIGVYFFSNDTTLTEPWKIAEDLTPNNVMLIDHPHSNIVFYFGNPIGSCRKAGKTDDSAIRNRDDSYTAYKSTPTPYISPTPTPTTSMVIQDVGNKLVAGKISEFIPSSEPANLSIITSEDAESKSDVLAKEISSILNKLLDPTYSSNTWIDNVQYQGITGTIDSGEFGILVPDSTTGNKAELTIWVSADSNLKRLKITGPLTTNDPQDAVRTVDITLKDK